MNPLNTRFIVLALSGAILSGCGLWSASEEAAPQPLVEFKQEKSFKVVWRVDVGSGFGERFNQIKPAVSESAVYAVDAVGQVSAVSSADGKILWQIDLDQPVSAGVGLGFGTLAVVLDSGELVTLNAADGSELWRVQLSSEVTAQPQINAQMVVVQQVNGQIATYSRESGEQLWVYDAQEPALTLRGTGTPLLLSDGMLAGFANGKVVALAGASGAPVWELRVGDASGRSELERLMDLDGGFVVANDLVFTGGYQGRVVAINPATASTVWTQKFSTYRGLATGFGNIYASDAQGAVEAFDISTSASVWRNSDLANRGLGTPVVLGNQVAVGDSLGYMHLLSQADGHFVSRVEVDSSALYADPVVQGDMIYVLSNAGKLTALTLK